MSHKVIAASYGRIVSVKYSPCGRYLAFAGGRGIFVYLMEDISLYRIFLTSSPVRAIAFAHYGGKIISACEDGQINIWDLSSGVSDREIKETFSLTTISINFSEDIIICGGEEGEISLRSLKNLECIYAIKGHEKRVNAIAIKENFLASGSSDGKIKLWQEEKNEIKELLILEGHNDEVLSLIFTHKDFLVSGGEDGFINFWTIPEGRLQKSIKRKNGITALASDSVEDILLSVSSPRYYGTFAEDVIEIYDLREEMVIQKIEEKLEGIVSISINPGGQYIAAGGFNETVKIWHKDKNYSFYGKLQRHKGLMRLIKFTPHETNLVSASSDGTVIFWHMATGEITKKMELKGEDLKTLAFSPSGSLMATFSGENILASGGKDKEIRIWYLREKMESFIIGRHEQTIDTLCFNNSGKFLVSGGMEGKIYIWDIEKKELIKILKGHEGGITSLCFSSFDRIISGSYDGTIKIWTFEGEEVSLKTEWSVNNISLRTDGKLFASATNNGLIQLWDIPGTSVPTLLKNIRLPVSDQYLFSVTFDKEGNLFIVDYYDNLMRLSKIKL
ncbi:MAG: WD domain, G-beta repeat [bacterium ADurb.Bin363]|nr:MAG: WD domain, G-beta repeat [bacterium ADurb.Bin363]